MCYVALAIARVPKAGTAQKSYMAHSRLGKGNKCTICGGKRPKKGEIGGGDREKRV